MKILVVTAHPDDFETGMGGLALRLTQAGHTIISIVMTAGTDVKDTLIRIGESKSAHAFLGVIPVFAPFFIRQLWVNEDSRNTFRTMMEKISPNAVFAMWGMDIHQDHRAVSILTIEPCLQKGIHTELFAMEVCSRPGVPQSLGFAPTHYCDITGAAVATKREMLACHKSQGFDSIRVAHEEMERNRGTECGVRYAEAFVRLTRCGELHPELAKFLIPSPYKLPRMMGIDAKP